MQMVVVLPANAKGPVPVLIMFAPARYPSPSQPNAQEAAKLDQVLKAMLAERDPSFAAVFKAHPGFELVKQPGFFPPPPSDERITDLIAAAGAWLCSIRRTIQPDNGAGLSTGIIGLANQGAAAQARRLGRSARLGLGREPRARLSRDAARGRREARRDRRRVALRQGRAGDHGVRSALRHGAGRLVRRRRGEAAPPQFRRSGGEPGRHRRVSLDGRQFPQIRRVRSRSSGAKRRTTCQWIRTS